MNSNDAYHQEISSQEISSQKIPSNGSNIHQLQTIQGQRLMIQEGRTGFMFPQYQGKIVLLQIFGKECPYCFEKMPLINQLKNQYAEDLQVIAIQAEDPMTPSEASKIINEHQINYPIIERDEASNLLLFIGETYNWTGVLPYMLLIKNGITKYTFSASTSYDELNSAIENLR